MTATRITWGALVIVLLAVILFQWGKVEPEVEDTALMMSSREILSSANEFKNYWVVNGQPKSMKKDGIEVTFSKLGWPLALDQNELNCDQWLKLLLPKKEKIYADAIILNNDLTKKEQYHCDYGMSNGKMISVTVINGVFKVSVDFLNKE